MVDQNSLLWIFSLLEFKQQEKHAPPHPLPRLPEASIGFLLPLPSHTSYKVYMDVKASLLLLTQRFHFWAPETGTQLRGFDLKTQSIWLFKEVLT